MMTWMFRRPLALILCGAALFQTQNVAALGLMPAYEAALANDPHKIKASGWRNTRAIILIPPSLTS